MKTAHEFVLDAKAQISEIAPHAAYQRLGDGLRLIDVREPAEFDAGHLPGAINVPRGLLEFSLPGIEGCQGANTPLLVYCKSSGRSALAVLTLQALGYTNVLSLAGGIEQWAAEGLPIHRPKLPSFE